MLPLEALEPGVTSCVLQAQQHIAQAKAHRSGEAGKQQPQEQPTAARRQGQLQQATAGKQQQHDQAIAQRQPIERAGAHVAGKALVLTAKGIERQADQPRRRGASRNRDQDFRLV